VEALELHAAADSYCSDADAAAHTEHAALAVDQELERTSIAVAGLPFETASAEAEVLA